jgi:hypothetical protein
MKTITLNTDNRSIRLVEDSVGVTVNSDHVRIGETRVYGISESNVTLHEGVTNAPEDWSSSKYFFDGSDWTENPDWVDPTADLPE